MNHPKSMLQLSGIHQNCLHGLGFKALRAFRVEGCEFASHRCKIDQHHTAIMHQKCTEILRASPSDIRAVQALNLLNSVTYTEKDVETLVQARWRCVESRHL